VEFSYDASGNLKTDANKGIVSLLYNHLNLPVEIWFNTAGTNKLKFTYSAAGVKLKKEVIEGGSVISTTDYMGGFVYEKDKLQFFPTEEGRALNPYFAPNPGGTAYTYEYHYKDHLGNLRLSFRDPKPAATFTATMETANAVKEDVQFANLTSTRKSDGKGKSSTSYTSLNSSSTSPKTLGPWKTLKVRIGDAITAKVYAHYDAAPSSGVSLGTFLGTASNVSGGSESGKNIPLLQLGLTINPVPANSTLPKAYLRYEYFDESYNYIGSDFKRVSVLAQGQTNAVDKWELLTVSLPAASMTKDGYVQIYVANESGMEVRFDDLEITYTEAIVVQENHFSPFGLALKGIEKQGQPDHKFKYNGKEFQEELGLNWNDYGARNYDPQLGRWHSIDPSAERYEAITPYGYTFNNPLRFIDLKGKDPGDIVVIYSGANMSREKQTETMNNLSGNVGKAIHGGTVIQVKSHYFVDDAKNNDITYEQYTTIMENLKDNPQGKVVIYGYSYGGVLATRLAKQLNKAGVKVDLLVTVDAANGWGSNKVDRKTSKNVKKNVNYYQKNTSFANDPTLSHGDANSGNNVDNIDMSNEKQNGEQVNHMNIDEATLNDVMKTITDLFNQIKEGENKTYSGDELRKKVK
jgi:RHS repeat-associated protein